MSKITAIEMLYRITLLTEYQQHDYFITGPNKKERLKDSKKRHLEEYLALINKYGWECEELSAIREETIKQFDNNEYQTFRIKWITEDKIAEGRF